MLADFHFLIPLWFLLLPLLVWLVLWLNQIQKGSVLWNDFIDEKLRAYVLNAGKGEHNRSFLIALSMAGFIAIVALAGPSWKKHTVPAFQTQQGLVVGMDLSTSMIINDISPSRLVRSRFKLIDLLGLRKEGQTGLVVFAGAAFAVSPLTDDAENISEQVKYLGPGTMPLQGSNVYAAIDESVKLLQQSEFKKGNILLITDGLSQLDTAIESAKKAKQYGYKVSILGVGTKEGGAIPLAGGRVLTNDLGDQVVAVLNSNALQQVATAGGGVYRESSLGDEDIQYLNQFFAQQDNNKLNNDIVKNKDKTIEYWTNEGIWLSLLLIPFVLLLFRQGVLFSLVLVFVVLPSEPVHAYEWDALWKNGDQRGKIALESQQAAKALTLFKRPDWKAAAAYKKEDYAMAERLYAQSDTAEADYNRGNALAKLKKIEEAIKAYQQALDKNPMLQDAKDNKALLEALKKEQDQQKNQKEKEDNKQDNSDQKDSKKNQKNEKKQDDNKKEGDKKQKNPSDKKDSNEDASDEKDKSQEDKENEAAKQEKEKKAKDDAEGVKSAKEKPEAGKENKKDKEQQKHKKTKQEQQKQQEMNQRTDQWLRKIPDDSAALWRRKFMYQYRHRNQSTGGQNPW
ncbi:MAG: VWA domain-containing protein [Cocleimonas sp.]|nr:VWA domain-containing protein [Cocleimonas sp.]